MLSNDYMKNLKERIADFKQKRTDLFTTEIRISNTYKRMFPRVISILDENERKLLECVNLFDDLCFEAISCKYELSDSKCSDEFIAELENIISQMENLIKEIDWTK